MQDKVTQFVRLATTAAVVGMLAALLVEASEALALTPAWNVISTVAPDHLPPGGDGVLTLRAVNLGDGGADGASQQITIHDDLPAGIAATSIQIRALYGASSCSLAAVTCTLEGAVAPYESLEMVLRVAVTATALATLENRVTVAGGGAARVSTREQLEVSSAPTSYGVEKLKLQPMNEDGSPDALAGSHPFQLTTTVALNQTLGEESGEGVPAGLTKDLQFELPPGLVGNPDVIPQCNAEQFYDINGFGDNQCPESTVIGVASSWFGAGEGPRLNTPLFNLTPGYGEPARFGFEVAGLPILLDTSVRTGGDYGVTVSVKDLAQVYRVGGSQVTFWGTPADPRHDSSRGFQCLAGQLISEENCKPPPPQPLIPFLTLPTSCTGPPKTSVLADSWNEPGDFKVGEYVNQDENGGQQLGLEGCNHLDFSPSLTAAPDGTAASTPTGLTVVLHVPQEATLVPTGLAESDVRNTTVTLPQGVSLNPAAADGLLSCSLEQVGLETADMSTCPDASKVGTVEIKTPLLPDPLTGEAYLAQQNANPFGSLIALYIVAEDPLAGVIVKLAGRVSPDPVTGQLVSTFENTPQLPFSDLKLDFFGGNRAPLSTPPLCGTYTTTMAMTPWAGEAPAVVSSDFQITSGPNGAPCANPRPFQPGFQAGTTSIQAGDYTPFEMTLSRPDADQTLSGIALRMAPGVLGSVSKVELCGEPQAAQGTCGPGSLIGHTTVSAGLGGDPFTVQGGQVFITGPYKGAPFGLSIVNPAKAGPFDLGYVVVRARIEVDPTDSHLTVISDPLPTIIQGIPLQLQHVQVSVDRPQFTFNPTDCRPLSITGTMSSTEGSTASVSTPFQVTNCAVLGFKPVFAVSTSGKTSRANGASLDVKLTYPSGPGQANIAKVKVELPKQLPSRLTTLQQACTEQTFAQNPESCPAASKVGEASASTPILAGPLSGPAYFVSHGGAKFPELIIVLKGENGVTVDLHGETFISKTGITSSTFATVPDVPVGSFELKLPQGRYSALAANGNLCKSKLAMPTEFIAQNGATLHQSTKLAVTGCPKAKKAKAKRAKRGHRGRRARGGKAARG